jgi:hypothetical protein
MKLAANGKAPGKGFLIVWKLRQPNLIPSLSEARTGDRKNVCLQWLNWTSGREGHPAATAVWIERLEQVTAAGRWA